MRIGYPCLNRSIGCTSSSTFRLKSYSEERMIEKVRDNLGCLMKMLEFNLDHDLLFFRISSDIVPFASHPVCVFDWRDYFGDEIKKIGEFVRKNGMRVSMHPDQFTLLNAKDKGIVERSIRELRYHCEFLDAMGMGEDSKVQIHVGGVYGNKGEAVERFLRVYGGLDPVIKKRLVIENDDRSYSLKDCLLINKRCGIPIVFDVLHHECLGDGEVVRECLEKAGATWRMKDGVLIVHYSSQKEGGRRGSHAESIDMKHFESFISDLKGIDADIMLEIKDKERSAIKAVAVLGL